MNSESFREPLTNLTINVYNFLCYISMKKFIFWMPSNHMNIIAPQVINYIVARITSLQD